MKKKVLFLLFVLVLTSHTIAESLYTLRSDHFEFIYPEESEETAIILYENAEALYEKANALLQADLDVFFPVYITNMKKKREKPVIIRKNTAKTEKKTV